MRTPGPLFFEYKDVFWACGREATTMGGEDIAVVLVVFNNGEELIVKITQLSEPYILYNKGIGMTAFNADFKCNLTIPNHVGIGKNASIGYGIVHLEKKDNN